MQICDLVFEQIDGRPAEVVGKNEDSLVTFTFTNTENSLGMHWSSVVAASGDKALYLAVYLFTLGETGKWSRLINYTFSEEKP